MDIILEAVVGSHAYGLNHPDSDKDTLGAFRAPLRELLRLDWHTSKETITNASPEGDDATYHELAKFIGQALKSASPINEVLWADRENYMTRTEIGNWIIENRKAFLSAPRVRGAYLGVTRNNLNLYSKTGHPKKAMHAARFADQGYQLYTTGELSVRVENPQHYLDFFGMEDAEILDIVTKAIMRLDGASSTPLPEKPNFELANDILIAARGLDS